MSSRERTTPHEIPGLFETFAVYLGGVSLSIQARNHNELPRPVLWVPEGDTLSYHRDPDGQVIINDRASTKKRAAQRLATLQIPASNMSGLRAIAVNGTPDTVHFEGNGIPLGDGKLALTARATGLIACTGGIRASTMRLSGESVVLSDVTVEELSGSAKRFGMNASEITDRSAFDVTMPGQIPAFQFTHHPDSP